MLFADGNEVDKTDFLLKNKNPIVYFEGTRPDSKKHMDDSLKDYRTYLNIRYYDKIRSTFLSTFLRFSKLGTEYFAECSYYVLTPINEDKYNIDKLPQNRNLFNLKVVIKTVVIDTIYMMFLLKFKIIIPLVLFSITVIPFLKIFKNRLNEYEYNKSLEEDISDGVPHNYGKLKTFRETIANSDYKNYFGAQDIIMMLSSIDESIINSLADLLDVEGFDSTFQREEMIQVVNMGIMQFGGKMEAEQITAGEGAKAISKKINISLWLKDLLTSLF